MLPTGPRGERLAQRVVNPLEPAVHVKRGGQRHERGDLASRAVVLVPQGEEQLVTWTQRGNRRVELLVDLLLFQLLISRGSTVRESVQNLGIEDYFKEPGGAPGVGTHGLRPSLWRA